MAKYIEVYVPVVVRMDPDTMEIQDVDLSHDEYPPDNDIWDPQLEEWVPAYEATQESFYLTYDPLDAFDLACGHVSELVFNPKEVAMK